MTEKEIQAEAEKLIKLFEDELKWLNNDKSKVLVYAKQCALTAVDEIIKTRPVKHTKSEITEKGFEAKFEWNTKFWLKVKSAIQNS